ncbi:MAG: hypothetical protein O3C21_12755, partial [Verrucomicrobia bacterium]|nr:hypothetical protein [Verrucomicrobiota bacterium]
MILSSPGIDHSLRFLWGPGEPPCEITWHGLGTRPRSHLRIIPDLGVVSDRSYDVLLVHFALSATTGGGIGCTTSEPPYATSPENGPAEPTFTFEQCSLLMTLKGYI